MDTSPSCYIEGSQGHGCYSSQPRSKCISFQYFLPSPIPFYIFHLLLSTYLDADGYTPLMIASFNGHMELVKYFISRDEDAIRGWGLYDRSNKAETAFFFACIKVRSISFYLVLFYFTSFYTPRKLMFNIRVIQR